MKKVGQITTVAFIKAVAMQIVLNLDVKKKMSAVGTNGTMEVNQ
jgi:hypothetical protein